MQKMHIKKGIKKDPLGSHPSGRKKGSNPMTMAWHRLRAVSLGLTARLPVSRTASVASAVQQADAKPFNLVGNVAEVFAFV